MVNPSHAQRNHACNHVAGPLKEFTLVLSPSFVFNWESIAVPTRLNGDGVAVDRPVDIEEDSLLLSADFTNEMMELYSPVHHSKQPDSKLGMPQTSRSFPVKFLNIMDPLLPTNNLGRSVSKASFARIRKALAHGAKSLTSIMAKVLLLLVLMHVVGMEALSLLSMCLLLVKVISVVDVPDPDCPLSCMPCPECLFPNLAITLCIDSNADATALDHAMAAE